MAPYQEDIDFVKSILNNDKGAWETFVEKYSSNIFLRAKSWTKKSYYKSDQEERNINQVGSEKTIKYTDETVDVYLWIFEQLKNNKLKNYQGKAPLQHYINSILADRKFMIDCIRKIKGQIKLPKCLKNLSRTYQQVFTYMTHNKHEGQIASKLSITYEKVIEIQNDIKNILQKNGIEYMVYSPEISEYNDDILYNETQQTISIQYNDIDLKYIIKKILNKLDSEEGLLLKMIYIDQISYKEILDSYTEVGRQLPGNINPITINENDLRVIIDKLLNKFMLLLKKQYTDLEKIKDLKKISEYLLEKLGPIYQ